MNKTYYLYIITNATRTVLYTGITNNLKARIIEHYLKLKPRSFPARYNVCYLLYYEPFDYILDCIAREKEIKKWSRKRKMELINTINPELMFLNENLFGCWPPKEMESLMRVKK